MVDTDERATVVVVDGDGARVVEGDTADVGGAVVVAGDCPVRPACVVGVVVGAASGSAG